MERWFRFYLLLSSVSSAACCSGGAWIPGEHNPVLGNEKLGTCFDVNVVTNGPVPYTMYFSWRPKHAIALVRSDDADMWTQEPEICLRADPSSGWEDEANRRCTVKRDGVWHMWYTGQAWLPGRTSVVSRIGSPDGITGWKHLSQNPIVVPQPGTWNESACFRT